MIRIQRLFWEARHMSGCSKFNQIFFADWSSTFSTLGPPNVAHRAATRAVAGIVEAAAARRQGDTVQFVAEGWG